jgi:peptidyl-prolyl cis-trans isomerase SurA
MVTSQIPNTPEMQRKVRDQVLEQLETEVLQRQESQKNDITVSSVEVDHYLQGILTENHMTKEQLQEILGRGAVQLATFRAQLAAQILWQKAVQEHYAGRVNISPEAVDSEMARIREGAGKAHFTVSEIFLAVDNPEQDERVKRDAQNFVTQIHGGGQFGQIARQFSQSASAAQGGDIGTVYDGQLAPELNAVLVAMHTGDVSAPIRSTGGYYVLQLRQRYEPAGTVIADTQPTAATLPAVVSLGRVLLRLPPNPPHDYIERVSTIAKQIQQVMNQAPNTCELAAKMPQNIPGVLYFALGPTRMSDLNEQTRSALAKAEVGGVAEPFRSDAGIEVFARCEQRIARRVAFPVPTREQVEQSLFQEQIAALARRYNRDLRRSANIETR